MDVRKLKKSLICCLLLFISLVCFLEGSAIAQEMGKISGYIVIDQNQITYRTNQACEATASANFPARTLCEVDKKYGGMPGFAYNCGARAFTEIFGYWANKGYSALMPTNVLPSGIVPDYSDQTLALFNLAGVEYTTYGDYDAVFGCHNCVTDFKAFTDYTESTPVDLLTKINAYFTVNGYSSTVIAKEPLPGYEEIRAEIIAGRPVVIASHGCNHWLTIIGYNDHGPNLIATIGHENFISHAGCWFLNTGPGIYEVEFSYINLAAAGGIAVFVIPAALPPPPVPVSQPAVAAAPQPVATVAPPVAPAPVPVAPSVSPPAPIPDQSIITYNPDGTVNRNWETWQP